MAAAGSEAVFELRPMNLADMLDAVIRLYRHNFGILIRIAAVIHIPLGIIQVASAALAVQGFDGETPTPAITMGTVAGGVGYALYFILLLLTMPIMQGAMAKAVALRHLGEEASVGDAYRFALKRWARLLGTTILYGMANFVAVMIPLIPAAALIAGSMLIEGGGEPNFTVAGVIAGLVGMLVAVAASVWVTFKLIFSPLVVVLEDRHPFEALGRSWNLTTDHFIRVAATLFVIGLLTGALTYMVAIPVQIAGALLAIVSPAGGQALAGTGMVVAQLFLQPIQIVASVLLYYDLRMRKEGFDLVMMAETIGEPQLATRTPEGVARAAGALYGMPPAPPPPPSSASYGVSDEPADSDQLPGF